MSQEKYLMDFEPTAYAYLQEYFSYNKPFDLDLIVPYLLDRFTKNSININRVGIDKILLSLLEQKLIVKGSTLTRDMVLKNSKRIEIYDYIKNNPGTYFSNILNNLNFTNHVITWHINILAKFEFIVRKSFDNREIFYIPSVSFKDAKVNYFLSRKRSQKILYYLKNNDYGLTKTQLATTLQMHLNTVTNYLDNLVDSNIVHTEKIDDKHLYFINEHYYNKLS